MARARPGQHRPLWLAATLAFGLLAGLPASHADMAAARQRISQNTIDLLGDGLGSTSLQMATELAQVMEQGGSLRIVPMVGKGSVQAVEDALLMNGVDVAVIQADVLAVYRQQGVLPRLDRQLRQIAKLADEELHILAGRGIASIDDLAGKRVNLGPAASGTFILASRLLGTLGIAVEAQTEPFGQALEQLRAGRIDAWCWVAGAPNPLVAGLAKDSELHLVPIPSHRVPAGYQTARLSDDDYPNLLSAGRAVTTMAVPVVLASYNFRPENPRRQKIDRFIGRLEEVLPTLQGGGFHPKWADADLKALQPGWRSFRRGLKPAPAPAGKPANAS